MSERMTQKLVLVGMICCSVLVCRGQGRTLNVPAEYRTIEAAMNAADPGDIVMIAPGSYRLNDYELKKPITLASWFLNDEDPAHIENTTIGGGALTIEADGTRIQGLTWISENDGLIPHAEIDLQHCVFRTGGDAVDYEAHSGGYLAHCLFENNRDDGIDLDKDVDIVIEHNVIRNNGDYEDHDQKQDRIGAVNRGSD